MYRIGFVCYDRDVIRAHKILLQPTQSQANYFDQAAGVARFAYNWGLRVWQDIQAIQSIDPSVSSTSQQELRRELNRIKATQYPWMLNVTKCAPQMALIHLGEAFQRFFKGLSKYPAYKRKGRDDRFTLTNDQFSVQERHIRIPKLGLVRMRESLRFQGKIVSATVSKNAGQWYVSIRVDVDPQTLPPSNAKNHGVVGIDLGVRTLATLWGDNGLVRKALAEKSLATFLPRLKKLSRAFSRKVKHSNGWYKALAQLQKLQARIANIRKDRLHKLTTEISSHYHTVGLEDLDVSDMVANNHRGLRRSLLDMSFYEFRRQLTYKMEASGGLLVVVDRYYPSSKTCSDCDRVFKGLGRGSTAWTCAGCGTRHDRDENAAKNLWRKAHSNLAPVS